MSCFTRHTIKLWTRISLEAVFQFIDFVSTYKWGWVRGSGGGVTRQSTHESLGDLLSLAGICQGAHTQIWDGDSCTGREGNQHPERPQAALQRQLQAVGLLQWEGWDIHFTPGKVAGIRDRKAINAWQLLNLQSTWFSFHPPHETSRCLGKGWLSSEGCKGSLGC